MGDGPEILVLETPIAAGDLQRLVATGFGDMVKFVADVERSIIAIGGQLHADAEEILLAAGSANYYAGRPKQDCVEFTSLINIRPTVGNLGMEIQDEGMSQHAGLLPERWARFTLEQQILMIANEMNRASKLLAAPHAEGRRMAYERVLALVDLTVSVHSKRSLRRELLRWRDLIAQLYIESDSAPGRHAEAFRSLLLLTPASSRQLPFVTMPEH